MKCPQCGLVTFDDLPACPRCKESFALVRPLASSSLAGARHMLRDDPELRIELRDRLHRARLDRRKNNDNPLAGSDPDAPDWFEPGAGGGNGAAEVEWAPTRGADEREEGRIVPIDDRSPDDDTGASTTSGSDGESDLIEASREPEDTDEPEFNGDVPGFTDWREELRERLKRIRARRKQEAEAEARRAADKAEEPPTRGGDHKGGPVPRATADEKATQKEAGAAAAEDNDFDNVVAGDAADDGDPRDGDDAEDDEALAAEVADEEEDDEALAAEVADEEKDDEAVAAEVVDEEDDDVPAAATAKDLIAQLVDGPGRGHRKKGSGAVEEGEVDFLIDRTDAIDDDPGDDDAGDDDPGDDDEGDQPEVLILGQKDAEPSAPRDDESDVHALKLVIDDEDDDPALELDDDDGDDDDPTLELDDEDEPDSGRRDEPVDEDEDQGDDEDGDGNGVGDSIDELAAAAIARASAKRPAGFDWGDAGLDAKTAPSTLEKPDADDARKEPDADDAHPKPEADHAHPKPEAEDAHPKPEADDPQAKPDADDADKGKRSDADATADEPQPDSVVDDEPEPAEKVAPKQEEKSTLPPVVMPDRPGFGSAPELDFEPPPSATQSSPDVDVPASARGAHADGGLEWDADTGATSPLQRSSAAPLGERAAASVCDALVLVAIGAALVGAASSGTEVPFREILVQETAWLALAWAMFAVGYSIFLVGACGQTIGRMVMRLRVIGDDQFSVGFDRAAIRLAAWVVSAVPILAGMLPALKDPQRRALHDRLSHTRVVKA